MAYTILFTARRPRHVLPRDVQPNKFLGLLSILLRDSPYYLNEAACYAHRKGSAVTLFAGDGDPARRSLRVELRGVRRHTKKKHGGFGPDPAAARARMSDCLDWLDWVAFNDLVNDALDGFGFYAHVYAPAVVWARRGYHRRVAYRCYSYAPAGGVWGRYYRWEPVGRPNDYVDDSANQIVTPGTPERAKKPVGYVVLEPPGFVPRTRWRERPSVIKST
jgi:hypothetical protein